MKKIKKKIFLFNKILYFTFYPIILLFFIFIILKILLFLNVKNIKDPYDLKVILNYFYISFFIYFLTFIVVSIIQWYSVKHFSKYMQNRLTEFIKKIEKSVESSNLENFPESTIKELNLFFSNIRTLIEENIILKNRILERYNDFENLLNEINAYLWIAKWDYQNNKFGIEKYELLTKGIEKITGYTPEEFIKSKDDLWYKIVFKEDIPIIQKNEKLLEKGEQIISKYRIIDKNNNIKWVLEVTYPDIDQKNKKLRSIFGLILDITNQIQLNIDLEKSVSRFEKFIENSQDGILIVNNEGKIVTWNEKTSEIMEVSSKDVMGKYIWDVQFELLPPELKTENTYKRIKHSLELLYIKKQAPWLNQNIEQQIYTPSGKRKDIIVTTFIIDYENFMTGSIIKDITTLKQFQKEAYKKQKIESIGILAGGIAHDFNNFLTIINGNLSLAKLMLQEPLQNMEKNEISKIIDEVIWASKKAKNLSTQLLTFSKKGSLIKKTINLYKLVKDSLSFSLTGKNIIFKINSFSKEIPFYCDENQFFQIFNNLTINSIHAINEKKTSKGVIKVEIKKINPFEAPYNKIFERYFITNKQTFKNKNIKSFLFITFYDNGIGIPDKIINKIFDPFFTTKQNGNGMGLTTIYSIVKKHGGDIFIDSVINKYTRFELLFPYNEKLTIDNNINTSKNKNIQKNHKIKENSEIISEIKQQEIKNKNLSIKKKHLKYKKQNNLIIVLEDNENIQTLIKNFCNNLQIQCKITSSGIKTINIIKKLIRTNTIPRLVLLDLTIKGGMGGLETNIRLKKIYRNLPTIVMSGYSNSIILSDYKKYNFNGILLKPFEFKEFNKIIESY